MVKNKKLSKSSVAVIVLALLLIASLVLGMTGAWFTDNQKGEGASNLNFGQIKVSTANPAPVGEVAAALHVPGDTYAVAGTVTNESTVESYVLIETEAYLVKDVEQVRHYYRVYKDAAAPEAPAEDVELITKSVALTLAQSSQWALVTGTNAHDGFYNVQEVDEDTAEKNVLTVTVTFSLAGEAFANDVYLQEIVEGVASGERQLVKLNGSTGEYKLYVSVRAKAVQAANLGETAAAREAAAYTILTGTVAPNNPIVGD